VVPVGNDAGEHGVPLAADPDAPGFVGDVPEELPAELVEPEEFGKLEFVELEFVEPEFVGVGPAPGFAVAGLEPGFEVAGFVEPAVPGALRKSVPHGDPLGVARLVLAAAGIRYGPALQSASRTVRRIRVHREGDWCQAWLVPENSIRACFPEKSRSATIPSGGFAETFAELSVVSQVVPTVSRSGPAAWPSGLSGVAVTGEHWAIVQLARQQSMDNNVTIFADINLASKTDSLVLPQGFSGREEMLRDQVAQNVLRKILSEITLR
jgi:hypothetical protein